MAWCLPKLPGYEFGDPTKMHFNMPQKFKYINGYRMPPMGESKNIGGQQSKVDGSAYLSVTDDCTFDPTLTYGRVKDLDLPIQLPHWVHYDKKKLSFRGFLRQSISESALEIFRIRPIVLTYYLEDDTLAVSEPTIPNSGLWHGKLVMRGKHVKGSGQRWHWKDLNNGIDIPLFGKVFHLITCDIFTREFLESQGIEVADEEEMPSDPYTTMQLLKKMHSKGTGSGVNKAEVLRKFLQYDGKVLKFYAIWDDTATEYGEARPCEIYYFLVDDTMSVKECHSRNDGKDPVGVLLKRMRVPQNWKERVVDVPVVSHEAVITEENEEEFFHPRDLIVGKQISILGRPFIITDCDPFTRNYFKCVLNIDQPPKVEKLPIQDHCQPPMIDYSETMPDFPPPIESHLDEPTPKDLIRMGINANKRLRYSCDMIPMNKENANRKFILSYNLSNGKMRLDEKNGKVSGFTEQCFAKLPRAKVPGTNKYYAPDNFYIGAIITINHFKFRITGCDLFVYRYMQEYPYKFPRDVIDNIRNYHYLQGNLDEDYKEETDALLKEGQTAKATEETKEYDPEKPFYDTYEKCMEHSKDPKDVPGGVQGIPCCQKLPSVVCFTGPAIPRRDDDADSVKSNTICVPPNTEVTRKKSVQFSECE